MIKRILFILALLFIAFAVYYYTNKDKAVDLISNIKEGEVTLKDVETGVNVALDQKEKVDAAIEDTKKKAEKATDEVIDNVKEEVVDAIVTAKNEVENATSTTTSDGATIVLNNPTFHIYQNSDGATASNTSSTSSSKTTASNTTKTYANGLTEADYEMIRRLAKNTDFDD